MDSQNNLSIGIVGLGYVGLPLAVTLARNFLIIGYDLDQKRVEELNQGYDRTLEVESRDLKSTSFVATHNPHDLLNVDIFIVTVPTPVDAHLKPDLTAIKSSCTTIGELLKNNPKKGQIVIFESTVYPGTTEDICGPLLEKTSERRCGVDFFLGYSPERINPGDKIHTVDKITKVIAGQTPEVTEILVKIYGSINNENIFRAKSIKAAEASKIIENAQRDINVAFINEVTRLFHTIDLSIYDVLEASRTKWNFLPFKPGLVGGHCIAVDPYYLSFFAQENGVNPAVILAGRQTNDSMGSYIGHYIHKKLTEAKINGTKPKLLILGFTFKEDVPDTRNTKVIDLYYTLHELGYSVDIYDPFVDPDAIHKEFNINVKPSITLADHQSIYDALIFAVGHTSFLEHLDQILGSTLPEDGTIFDVKGLLNHVNLPETYRYITL